MFPNVYSVLRSNAAVLSGIGTRIYRHGDAPQNVEAPYITWFVVSDNPIDDLSSAPSTDIALIQIDIWSEQDKQVETIATNARAALDAIGAHNRVVRNTREEDTKLYLITLEAQFITDR